MTITTRKMRELMLQREAKRRLEVYRRERLKEQLTRVKTNNVQIVLCKRWFHVEQ